MTDSQYPGLAEPAPPGSATTPPPADVASAPAASTAAAPPTPPAEPAITAAKRYSRWTIAYGITAGILFLTLAATSALFVVDHVGAENDDLAAGEQIDRLREELQASENLLSEAAYATQQAWKIYDDCRNEVVDLTEKRAAFAIVTDVKREGNVVRYRYGEGTDVVPLAHIQLSATGSRELPSDSTAASYKLPSSEKELANWAISVDDPAAAPDGGEFMEAFNRMLRYCSLT